MNEEDIFIKMLRFGKSNLGKGIRPIDMVDHLKKQGYPSFTENHNIMHHYWLEIFFSVEGDKVYNAGTSNFYFIRPGKYMMLLEYDKMIAAKQSSNRSLWIAIGAISLSLLAIVVDIILDFN